MKYFNYILFTILTSFMIFGSFANAAETHPKTGEKQFRLGGFLAKIDPGMKFNL